MVRETAMEGESATISIEVSGIKSFFLVGVPSHPQPDNSRTITTPDHSSLTMYILRESQQECVRKKMK
jgi:hypothetical protein